MAIPTILTNYHGGHQSVIRRIVIHGTVSPCERGGARAVARYFQSPKTGGSAHYVVDPGEIVRCVPEDTVAYHAPPNTGSIGIELCDPQRGDAKRWNDDNHQAMLQLAAGLVRDLCQRRGIPMRKLTVAQVKAGAEGVCGHVDVSNAFHQTDHSDPGPHFPWDEFMHLVNRESTTPKPAEPKPEQSWTEDLMKDLPLLRPGDDNYDVKTARADLFARGHVSDAVYAEEGLKEWLEHTKYDPELADLMKAFQRAKKLDDDALVGPKTWAALLRVA